MTSSRWHYYARFKIMQVSLLCDTMSRRSLFKNKTFTGQYWSERTACRNPWELVRTRRRAPSTNRYGRSFEFQLWNRVWFACKAAAANEGGISFRLRQADSFWNQPQLLHEANHFLWGKAGQLTLLTFWSSCATGLLAWAQQLLRRAEVPGAGSWNWKHTENQGHGAHRRRTKKKRERDR